MPAYILADVEVTDEAGFRAYQAQVAPTLTAFGGEFIVRSGRTEVLEGGWTPHRLVMLCFPSYDLARAWYHSPEYQPLIAQRMKAARTTVVLADGV